MSRNSTTLCRSLRTGTLRALLAATLLLFASLAAALHPKDFQSPEEEARYRALAKELRCVMCQNQSLADSPAGVADDMRRQVLTLIREGKTDAEITAFFQARYGDFILYRPEVKPVTWALWFGPLLLLIVGAGVVVTIVRRQQPNAPATPPAEDRQEW
ncbi:MAG: cytochrome c-type biogenesis protein [Silanimonas sp.]